MKPLIFEISSQMNPCHPSLLPGKIDFQVNVADVWFKKGPNFPYFQKGWSPVFSINNRDGCNTLNTVNVIDQIYINKDLWDPQWFLRIQGGPRGSEMITNMFQCREVTEKVQVEEQALA